MIVHKKIVVMGSRVTFLHTAHSHQKIKQIYALGTKIVKTLKNSHHLYVITPADVRMMDIKTGRLTTIDFNFAQNPL